MYRRIALTILAISMSGPTFADVGCATVPAEKFAPQATLEAKLAAEGLTVRKIKVENGCYEVYAIDKAGNKANAAYNAETLDKVENAEAGEN
jgi:hypothetical protein